MKKRFLFLVLASLASSTLSSAVKAADSPAPQFIGLTLGYSNKNQVLEKLLIGSNKCEIEQQIGKDGNGFIQTKNCLKGLHKFNKINFYIKQHKLDRIRFNLEELNREDQKKIYRLLRKKFGPAWSVQRYNNHPESAEWRYELYEVKFASYREQTDGVSIVLKLHDEFYNNKEKLNDYSWMNNPKPSEDFSFLFKN